VALREPEVAPLLAVCALVDLTGAAAISIRLVAVGAIVAEAIIVRAVLPAHGANTTVARLAEGVAESAILLLFLGAGIEGLTSRAPIGSLPAGVRHVRVMVVVVVVVDGCTVVILLGVSQGLLGSMGVVRHVLFILIVAVVALVSHWVVVLTVETSVVVGAIIEVTSIVVLVVVMTVLGLGARVVALKIAAVVSQVLTMVQLVVLFVKTLDVVVVNDVIVGGNVGHVRQVLDYGVLVVWGDMGHLLEMGSAMKNCLVSLVMSNRSSRSGSWLRLSASSLYFWLVVRLDLSVCVGSVVSVARSILLQASAGAHMSVASVCGSVLTLVIIRVAHRI